MTLEKHGKNRRKWQYSVRILIGIFIVLCIGCESKYKDLNLEIYQYRDTKNLVKFVYDAALILEKEGIKSLDYFDKNRDLYNKPDHYLYIYDMNGINIYHAGMKELQGQNLIDVVDKDGKKVTREVLAALEDEDNPHAWIHYTWWESEKFYLVPKSSCHFKVTTPEGKTFLVGSGLNYPHEEKEFIRIVVDNAVELIETTGIEALAQISSPVTQYNYRDVRVFVFRPDGEILISPVITEIPAQLQLLNCVDEVGYKPFVHAIERLASEESVWEIFMAKNRYQRTLVKKCMYIRKAKLNDEILLVGAITNLPQPAWAG